MNTNSQKTNNQFLVFYILFNTTNAYFKPVIGDLNKLTSLNNKYYYILLIYLYMKGDTINEDHVFTK